jgi:hypothetical protein
MNATVRKILAIYVFAYVFFLASRPVSDGDFWWHLKAGEYILQTHSIPRTDFYSFTNYGKPWVAHEWLSEAIFYGVYSRLGLNALILIFALLTALAFWIVFKRSEAHPIVAGFAVLLGALTVLPTVGVRPRVFTLLLTSVYLALLSRYARGDRRRAIWWLLLLMILWVNLHGGFLIGLVLIGITMVGMVLDAWTESVNPAPNLYVLAMVFVGCLAAAVFNPQGVHIYAFPFEIFLSPVQQGAIVDWFSPDFHQRELLPFAALIILSIAVFALSPKRPRPSELLLFLATLFMSLKSYRHMAIFAIVAAPLLAEHAQAWLESLPGARRLVDRAPVESKLTWPALVLLLPLLFFAFALKAKVYVPLEQQQAGVPINAVSFLREQNLTGNTFTEPSIWGGYLIWALPSNPVYIDGRIDMYGDQFVSEYLDIIRGMTSWREPFNRYGVKIVIVRPHSMLARKLSESAEWRQVFQDKLAVVFVR